MELITKVFPGAEPRESQQVTKASRAARRWRRWARDSTREVLAHNAFIATGAREAPDFMDDAAFDAYVDRAFEVQGVVI